jgi:hypothetical protein
MRREQKQRDPQWYEIVNDSIGQQRTERLGGRNCVAQTTQNNCLENSDTSRHLADDARDHRQQIESEKCEVADPRVRQQDEQHAARHCEIDRAENDLREGEARRRQAKLPATNRERALEIKTRERVRRHDHEEHRTDRAQRAKRWCDLQRKNRFSTYKQASGQDAKAHPECHDRECNQPSDLQRIQPPRRVEPIPDSRAAQHGEPNIVAEDAPGERREEYARVVQFPTHVSEREGIVA